MTDSGPGPGFNDYQNLAARVLAEAKVQPTPRSGPRDLPTGWWPQGSVLRVALIILAVVVMIGWILTALNN